MALILTGSSGSTTLDSSAGLTFSDSSNQQYAASPYVLKNRIINGAMVIDQRNAGASVSTTPTDSKYTIDRWATIFSVANKYTVQQNAGSVTPPTGFTNYVGITSSSAYTPASSSEYYAFYQSIEGYNIADLGWGTANAKTVTLSFWVRSSLTGTFSGALYNSGASRSYPYTFTISAANTWTQISVTIPGDTSGTWLTTNGIGLSVVFNLGSGSTLLGTANTWAGTWYTGVTGSVSVIGTNGATFYITGVQLEVGSTATPFERRLYGQELANCQRYFWMAASGLYKPVMNACSIAASATEGVIQYPVTMRTSPTLYQSTGTDYYSFYRANANDYFNSFAIDYISDTCAAIYNSTQISGTIGQAGWIFTNNASAYVGFTAEL